MLLNIVFECLVITHKSLGADSAWVLTSLYSLVPCYCCHYCYDPSSFTFPLTAPMWWRCSGYWTVSLKAACSLKTATYTPLACHLPLRQCRCRPRPGLPHTVSPLRTPWPPALPSTGLRRTFSPSTWIQTTLWVRGPFDFLIGFQSDHLSSWSQIVALIQ